MVETRAADSTDHTVQTVVGVVVVLALVAGVVFVVLPAMFRCVVAGTLVDTPRGPRPVETLRVGDELWTDGARGLERGRVVAVRTQVVFSRRSLVLTDGRELAVTASHPVATRRGWTQAGALRAGDGVSTLGTRPVRLRSATTVLGPVTVYDLTVEPNPNFFANGMLVHNKSGYSTEGRAIADLRSLVSAQAAYQSANHGFYDTPECLQTPGGCMSDSELPYAFLNEDFVFDGAHRGYVFEFHPEPALPDEIPEGASPTSLRAWALIATPEVQNRTGVRGFCTDASGRICFTVDGSAVELVDGMCHPDCTALQ